MVPWNQLGRLKSRHHVRLFPSAKNFVRPGHFRGNPVISDPVIRRRIGCEDCDSSAVATPPGQFREAPVPIPHGGHYMIRDV
jgi:hypothetical protein